jgi:ABC-2 type transport system ATP-binding protein
MIIARDLTKIYTHVAALEQVSFDIREGEIIGVIGHNGAGKTTLLKILSGLITPTSGDLSMNGIDVVMDPDGIKGVLGYLSEESRLYETMTVDDYLRFFGEIYGLDQKTISSRRSQLLGALSLEPNGKKIGEFSKGMKRKVAIARSLMHNPSVLIYDEPTSGLDPMTSRYIVGFLRDLRNQKKTIVLSAHNLYQVETICDKVMILRRGKMVAMGTMNELREMFGSISYTITFTIDDINTIRGCREYTFEGGYYRVPADTIDELNKCTGIIASHGGRVERIESHYPSLEEMLVKVGK